MKTATIMARTEPGLKADAERVFRKLGISSSEATNLFLLSGPASQGAPLPRGDSERRDAPDVRKTDRGEDLHDYPSLDDFFKKMGA